VGHIQRRNRRPAMRALQLGAPLAQYCEALNRRSMMREQQRVIVVDSTYNLS
jgi:hypothetical protein